ncbi:MAG: YdeI/OmpD-associated family protein [Devosia indica]
MTWKKHRPYHVTWDEVVEEALCFGWIDSQPRKLDENRSMLRLSPRKSGSAWSGVNKERVKMLIDAGRMQPSGLAKIEVAKTNGSWSSLDKASDLKVPDDLAAAFSEHPGALQQFMAFPPSARRAILEWISLAKRSETRANRVQETARLAQIGQRANQWRKPK